MRSRGRRPRLRPEAQTELERVDDGTDHQGLAQELKDLLPLDKSREDSDALDVYEELERSARGRGR